MATHFTPKVTWHTNILPRPTQKALSWLANQEWLRQSRWYLAGGTALTLQHGHRVSMDLDFFTTHNDFNISKLTANLKHGDWQETFHREGTLYGTIAGGKVSFIAYPFFKPIMPYHHYGAIRVLDARDIAVMKIVAISQRGSKRDFFDLYWYVQHQEPLYDVMTRLKEQYPGVAHDYHHIIKSLVYFTDAENDPTPQLRFRATWKQIKLFFQKEIKLLIPHLIFLS